VPRLPCRSLPAFANVEQEQKQQSESDRSQRAAAAIQQNSRLEVADQVVMPAASRHSHESKHPRVYEASRAESQSSKLTSRREAKRAGPQIVREAQASKRERKREASHLAREGHASKHEAAHTPRGRERHRSA
jgi:hypothetical protein